MNKRIRKKRFKKINGENPPKWLKLIKCRLLPKPKQTDLEFEFQARPSELERINKIFDEIVKKKSYKKNTNNLVNTTKILSERRKK